MADDTQDIFGKIDAMLGKRSGFAMRSPTVEDEFPLLTEVVSEGTWTTAPQHVDALSAPAAEPDSTASDSKASDSTRLPSLSEVDIDRLAAALEARLSELFIRQQLRIESLVRRIVREELDARED